MENLEWLKDNNWSPKQTESAASLFRITQYDNIDESVKKVIVDRAKRNDLNAKYAVLAGKLNNELNQKISSQQKIDIYSGLYDLAKDNQVNAQSRLVQIYNEYELIDEMSGYDVLKKITRLNNVSLNKLMKNYFLNAIQHGNKALIKDFIAFNINDGKPENEMNSFSFEMYNQNLQNIKSLNDKDLAENFYKIVNSTFNENHDGNLALYVMQFNAYGIGTQKNMIAACKISKSLSETNYSNIQVYKEINKILTDNEVTCFNSKEIQLEWDKPKLNEWYSTWK